MTDGEKSAALVNFERMLASGRDGALLRFSLGNEHLKAGDAAAAVEHLQRAVEVDPNYTAAWKLLGKAHDVAGDRASALEAYRRGIAVAQARGDKQAEKEMTVFARRIERSGGVDTDAKS
jgi:predicted Zn-dependent protease